MKQYQICKCVWTGPDRARPVQSNLSFGLDWTEPYPRLGLSGLVESLPSTAYTKYIIHQVQHTLSTAYTKYSIHQVQHTPSTAYTKYSIHRVQHTPSTAYTQYSIHPVQHTPSTAFTEHSIHRVHHTPSTAYTKYSIHQVQHTLSTASTPDCLSSLHPHEYELTLEYHFSFQRASLQDQPPPASSPC